MALKQSPGIKEVHGLFPLERSKYELLHKIGRSESNETHAIVYLAKCIETEELVTAKVIDLDTCPIDVEQIHREYMSWATSSHKHMVKYYGSFIDGSMLWLLTEYMSGGSIADVMSFAFQNGFDEKVVATILRYVLKFLVYYHQEKHIHRNLSTSHIMITNEGVVKVGGLTSSATLIQEGLRKRARYTVMKSSAYAAPEVLMEGIGYSENVDIWSLGIIAYELCEGTNPYRGKTNLDTIRSIVSNAAPELPADKPYSSQMKDFIKQCLTKDPQKRPSAASLLKHSLMKKAKNKDFLAPIMEKLPPLERRFELISNYNDTEYEEFVPKDISFDFDVGETQPPQQTQNKPSKIGRFTVTHSKLETIPEHVESEVKDLLIQVAALEESNKELQDLISATQESVNLLLKKKAESKK